MAVTFPGVVDVVPVGDFGQQGAWVVGEGVESQSVDDDTEDLVETYQQCGLGCRDG